MLLVRALSGFSVMVILMFLVVWQIHLTKPVFLTVENMMAVGEKGLSFDRHYAMPLDFCIIAPFVGLCIFLCMPQWDWLVGMWVAILTAIIIAACLLLWRNGNEAHAHGGLISETGWVHALFAYVGVWVVLMVLLGTKAPPPVLLLVMCIVVPAFFFVGTHMFLGLINFARDARTFPDLPLSNPVGWAVLAVASAVVWRVWMLIPAEFWRSI